MEEIPALPAFQCVVSEKGDHKLGMGATNKKTTSSITYYAEKSEGGQLFVQPLNGSHVPSGRKTYMEDAEFCRRFKPEPLIFYNQVKPAMDCLDETLDKADRHRKAERHEKARQTYEKALSMDPDNLRAIFGMGISTLAAGNVEEAGQIFEKLMSLDFVFAPQNKHLFNEFGIRMRKAGMLQESLQWYNKALECCSEDPHLHYNLGRVHYELSRMEVAVHNLETALNIDPGLVPASRLLQVVRKSMPQEQSQEPANASSQPPRARNPNQTEEQPLPAA